MKTKQNLSSYRNVTEKTRVWIEILALLLVVLIRILEFYQLFSKMMGQ